MTGFDIIVFVLTVLVLLVFFTYKPSELEEQDEQDEQKEQDEQDKQDTPVLEMKPEITEFINVDNLVLKINKSLNDQIDEVHKSIQQIQLQSLVKVVKPVPLEINIDMDSINTALDDYIKAYTNCIKNKEPIGQNQEVIQEVQEIIDRKTNKTIYPIVPDKYLDLLERDLDNTNFNNSIVKYMGNFNITLNIQNNSEFWYMEVHKDKIKYGFNLKQKRRVQDIVALIKYTKGFTLTKEEHKSFNYIKKIIKGI